MSQFISQIIPNRPSQGVGRVHKFAALAIQTADATLYTVTAGKTLYLTSLSIFAFNTSTTTVGDLQIKDGAGGTLKLPILMTAAGVAASFAASAAVGFTVTFDEPLQFTTGVYCDIITGTITYSVMANGYEE